MHNCIRHLLKIAAALLAVILIIILTLTVLRGLFPSRHRTFIDKYCIEYNVDPYLVLALIKAESNFRTDAKSHAGAKGLMQLTDSTFEYCMSSMEKDFSAEEILVPEKNICAGVWYLGFLLKKYDGNTKSAIAAYNAGFSNVDKWLADSRYSVSGKELDEIPFGETRRHIEKIDRYYKVYKFLY